MSSSGWQLLCGICTIVCWTGVTTQCSPPCESPLVCVSSNQDSTCECPAGFEKSFRIKTNTFTCSGTCQSGFIKKIKSGVALCLEKCENDDDCPPNAICRQQGCYCEDGMCHSKYIHLNTCFTNVKLDEKCAAQRHTTEQSMPVTSSVQMSRKSVYTSTQSTLKSTSGVQQTETSEPEHRCKQYSKDLEKCNKANQQDALCTLLRQNADIQEDACQHNVTTIYEVANRFTKVLNHTTLSNLTTSELRSAVSSILKNVENSLLVTFSKDPQSQNISTPELEVDMKASRDICDKEGSITLTVQENTMKVDCKHVSGVTDGALFITYKGLESKLNGNFSGGPRKPKLKGEINSPIVSGAITSNFVKNMEPPVTFYLKQQKRVPPSYTLKCVFWDTDTEDWSTYGCETNNSDRINNTLCSCNHLSTFAVIMAPGDFQDDGVLTLISRIGLSVSLFFLILTLLTFFLCRSLRNNHTSVLTALCGCLFLGQLLVLVGLHQTGNRVLCSVITGSLQFFFLCAFCWMSLESILLFLTVKNVRAVNYLTSQRSYFPYVCLVGFGIPLIIVVISVAINPGAYGREKYCWLSEDHVWSFLGPICVFISINLILLILTFVLLRRRLACLNTNVSTLKDTRLLTFKSLSQLLILGCTWIFGIFQFGSGAQIMAYIFTICNSFQGFYIFLVHCLLNRQVREIYRRGYHRMHSKKLGSEGVSGSTVPVTMKFSQVSETAKLERR